MLSGERSEPVSTLGGEHPYCSSWEGVCSSALRAPSKPMTQTRTLPSATWWSAPPTGPGRRQQGPCPPEQGFPALKAWERPLSLSCTQALPGSTSWIRASGRSQKTHGHRQQSLWRGQIPQNLKKVRRCLQSLSWKKQKWRIYRQSTVIMRTHPQIQQRHTYNMGTQTHKCNTHTVYMYLTLHEIERFYVLRVI